MTQQVFNDAGGYRDVTTTATTFFGGDGDNHWHVRDLASYQLARLDNGTMVGTDHNRASGSSITSNID